MTIALARRYRPKRFSDLILQEHVASVLRGAIQNKRVAHGYLLTGPRGVGKTTAARILAMALNCDRGDPEHPTGEPCGECDACQRIWKGSSSLDVIEIDAASNRGVDDARQLRERAMYAPSQEGHYKVYIVDEAHMLTREAWNALLKILEEPPPQVIFVFATTEPHKIAATAAPVMSRLQRFDFRRIGPAAIQQRLETVLGEEDIEAEPDALLHIARHADGGMRDALSVLDQCLSLGEGIVTVERVREVLGLVPDEIYAELLDLIATRNAAGVFELVERLVDGGADLTEFMTGAAEALRAALKVQVGATADGLTETLREAIERSREDLPAGELLRMLKLLADSEVSIRRGGSPRVQVETLLLRWTMMDRLVDLQQVISGGSEGRVRPSRRTAGDISMPAQRQPAPAAPAAPAALADDAPAEIPFTLDAIRASWPGILESSRSVSRFLGQALAVSEAVEVTPPMVRIRLNEANDMFNQALVRNRGAFESILAQRVGQAVKVELEGTQAAGGEPGAPAKPERYSEERIKADRLDLHRASDPALDAAAKELDLEIMD